MKNRITVASRQAETQGPFIQQIDLNQLRTIGNHLPVTGPKVIKNNNLMPRLEGMNSALTPALHSFPDTAR